jgi:hypothetical protein
MILGNIDDILEGSQPCPKLWRLELTKWSIILSSLKRKTLGSLTQPGACTSLKNFTYGEIKNNLMFSENNILIWSYGKLYILKCHSH